MMRRPPRSTLFPYPALFRSRDEGGRMKDESDGVGIHFILHPSAFIPSFVALPAEAFAVAARPRVAAHVVAALLPEARAVFGEKLDALDPLGRLPGVEARDDEADGAAVFGRDGLAVVRPGEERVLGEEIFDGEVRRPAVVGGFDRDERCFVPDADQLGDGARPDGRPEV